MLQISIRKNGRPTPESTRQLLEECKRKARIRSVEIIVQDYLGTPSLFGLLKPKILLPPDILKLSDSELSYILLHELAHYKRRDLIANHLLLVLQIIHWFDPVIWYCFKMIRQDMEAAADEAVLSLLDGSEHKEYGKALLAVLGSFNSPRFAPRIISMVDDKKNIERRIKMIKMAGFFKSKRRLIMTAGLLCVVVLGGALLTNANSKQPVNGSGSSRSINGYNAEEIYKYKTPYVGDNSKVINLTDCLAYASLRGTVSLQTDEQPYGVTVNYVVNDDIADRNADSRAIFSGSKTMLGDLTDNRPSHSPLPEDNFADTEHNLRNNAALMFALIGNVDELKFVWKNKATYKDTVYIYTRAQIQRYYAKDLRD